MNENEEEAIEAFSRFLVLIQNNWEGAGPPSWADIVNWLHLSIPIAWSQGRKALDEGLEKARHFHSNRHAPTGTANKDTGSGNRSR
jgi:hypothetical protein